MRRKPRAIRISGRHQLITVVAVCALRMVPRPAEPVGDLFFDLPGEGNSDSAVAFAVVEPLVRRLPRSAGTGDILLVFLTLRHRQLITAVVVRILRVALDPMVTDGMNLCQGQQPVPEIRFRGGLLVSFFQPLAFQPLAQPFSSPSITYLESDRGPRCRSSFSRDSAWITAVSSMRLCWWRPLSPESSRLWGAVHQIAPQPPGPDCRSRRSV